MKARTNNIPTINGHFIKTLKDFVYDFYNNTEKATFLVPRTVYSKRKSKGSKSELIKKLEETITILEEKCKKIMKQLYCFFAFTNFFELFDIGS